MTLHRFKLEAPTLEVAFQRAREVAANWMGDQPIGSVEGNLGPAMEFDLLHAATSTTVSLLEGADKPDTLRWFFEIRRIDHGYHGTRRGL